MATNRATFNKRQREKQRQEAKRMKAEKKAMRQSTREDDDSPPGVDPDIAGIVPGPQPIPEEAAALDTDMYKIDADADDVVPEPSKNVAEQRGSSS